MQSKHDEHDENDENDEHDEHDGKDDTIIKWHNGTIRAMQSARRILLPQQWTQQLMK